MVPMLASAAGDAIAAWSLAVAVILGATILAALGRRRP